MTRRTNNKVKVLRSDLIYTQDSIRNIRQLSSRLHEQEKEPLLKDHARIIWKMACEIEELFDDKLLKKKGEQHGPSEGSSYPGV